MHQYFFFNDTATTEIYTLSLHDALPISIIEYIVECFGGIHGVLSRHCINYKKGFLWIESFVNIRYFGHHLLIDS